MITELNDRSREIFRFIVDSYLSTGSPVGSTTISRESALQLSSASIRNAMADLESLGLLFSPHTSAGRLPTELGLRLYIDGLMQIGGLSQEEKSSIESSCKASGQNLKDVLDGTSAMLSGLSSCASLVIAPKESGSVKQVQFVQLEPKKVLTILVMQNGLIENRILDVDEIIPPGALDAASNYLNHALSGRTFSEAEAQIKREIETRQTSLDTLTEKLITRGIALPQAQNASSHIIVRGQSHLLSDVKALEDLERARSMLAQLEEQKHMLELLSTIDQAEGVQIFIGTENKIFDQAGWSMVISPYKNAEQKIVGAIGVIGPTRLSYGRIIPMVDFTSRAVSKFMERS